MALLEIKNLSFSYALSSSKAIDDISLSVDKGELILLMGKSGSGKSTLLRLIKKELAPAGSTAGKINCTADGIGFVWQNTDSSFVSDNVRGELAFALENKCMKSSEIALKIGELASYLNISHKLDCKTDTLSGGERAVVAIASAMITSSELLLLDEPFAQLDPKATVEVASLIKRLNQELGVTIILSSHSSDEVIDFCDRMIVLDEGRIISDSTINNSAKNDELLPYFPVCTRLFNERPLTVKQAIAYSGRLSEKSEVDAKNAEITDIAVEAKRLTFAYGRRERDILTSLDYTAYKGKINCIIGANGSGKTTLIKTLAGIKKAYSGKIKLSGTACYMPQNVKHMFTKETVGEEISAETASTLGLAALLDRHPYDLSGGQAQLLALGILLEQRADIFLLDEPTKSLDCFAKDELSSLLKDLANQGKTIVIVTHDLELVGEIGDYTAFLSDGSLAMAGITRQVLSHLDFYTTQIRRITKSKLKSAVAWEDLIL